MSSLYGGNAANYPTNFTIPDDSDPPTAAAFNPAVQALGDRTANLAASRDTLGPIQATNFPYLSTVSGSAFRHATHSPATRSWYLSAGVNRVDLSRDNGITWVSEVGVGSVGTGQIAVCGACDSSGNVVIGNNSTDSIFEKTASTGVWTVVDVGASDTPVGESRVVHDPVSGRFVWIGVASSGEALVRYSSNRTAWSSPATPMVDTVDAPTMGLACKRSTGRIIAVSLSSGTQIRAYRSDDGGVNWTQILNDTSTLSSDTADRGHLSYAEDTNTWIYTVGRTSVLDGEVWRSTNDGSTWTRVATLGNAVINAVASHGGVLLATAHVSGGYEVVYSLDNGATWRFAGVGGTGVAFGVFVGGQHAIMVGQTNIRSGMTIGTPSLGVAT